MEITYLPTTGPAAAVGAIGFLAVLAYPADLRKRDKLISVLKAGLLKSIIPQGRRQPILRKDLRELQNRGDLTGIF